MKPIKDMTPDEFRQLDRGERTRKIAEVREMLKGTALWAKHRSHRPERQHGCRLCELETEHEDLNWGGLGD